MAPDVQPTLFDELLPLAFGNAEVLFGDLEIDHLPSAQKGRVTLAAHFARAVAELRGFLPAPERDRLLATVDTSPAKAQE